MDTQFLKKVVLFKNLSPEELKIFSAKLRVKSFKAEELIIHENAESYTLYILHSGSVMITKKLTMIEYQSDEDSEINKTFTVLKSADHPFFGEIGLLGFSKRTANAIAQTDCEVYTLSQKDFLSVCNKYPLIGYKVSLEISRKLAYILEKTNEDVLKLTTALIYALKG